MKVQLHVFLTVSPDSSRDRCAKLLRILDSQLGQQVVQIAELVGPEGQNVKLEGDPLRLRPSDRFAVLIVRIVHSGREQLFGPLKLLMRVQAHPLAGSIDV